MTDEYLRALARETLSIVLVPLDGDDFIGANHKTTISGVEEFGRRLIAIGRAEAFDEMASHAVVSGAIALVSGEWLSARAAEERGRAKS